MIPTSDRFLEACRSSHVMRTVVDVYHKDDLIYEDMPITEGNLVIDDAPIRTSLTLTSNLPDLSPSERKTILYPGNNIRPRNGVVYPDGTSELIDLGILDISITRIDDSGDGFNLRIDAYDRARRVSRTPLSDDWWVHSGSDLFGTVQSIVTARIPWVDCNFPEVVWPIPKQIIQTGDDPWAWCQSVCASYGYDLFFDRQGILTAQLVVADPDEYAATYDDDILQVTPIIYINRQVSDEHSYSRVVVTGESTSSPPVRAEALDLDTASPTYIYGDFGDVPYRITSSKVHSVSQAQAMADRELLKRIGYTDELELLIGVNPAHELQDMIRVDRNQSDTHADYIISKITIPLIPDRGMNMSGRLRRLL